MPVAERTRRDGPLKPELLPGEDPDGPVPDYTTIDKLRESTIRKLVRARMEAHAEEKKYAERKKELSDQITALLITAGFKNKDKVKVIGWVLSYIEIVQHRLQEKLLLKQGVTLKQINASKVAIACQPYVNYSNPEDEK